MKYRSRFTITCSILRVAQDGNSTKTRLMYGAYLSFKQINEYLDFLQSNALIIRNETSHTYAPTAKGLHFLHMLEEMEQLAPMDPSSHTDAKQKEPEAKQGSPELIQLQQ